jgi:hypothetical protein
MFEKHFGNDDIVKKYDNGRMDPETIIVQGQESRELIAFLHNSSLLPQPTPHTTIQETT